MKAPCIIIVGAEGSGTTLLWHCITRHPQFGGMTAVNAPAASGPLPSDGVILHLSLPTLRPMRWFDGAAAPRGAKVIVLRRSPLHTVFSAYRRFYKAPKPAWRNYFRAVALEADWVARHQPLGVSYEDLVHNTASVLRRVYEFLGVDPDFVPSIAITDQNDERWRRDARFAAWMQRAFGVAPAPREQPDEATPVAFDFRSHGTRISITDASGAGVAEALRAALPPDLEPAGDGVPSAEYTVARSLRPDGAIVYGILADGEVRLRARDRGRLVDWLRTQIDNLVAQGSRRSLFVHAGAVGWRGHAIVIPGRTLSGKSRLVAELVRCGATYYSDEFAVLDEEGRVLPYARQVVQREPRVEVDLGPRRAAEPLPIGLIVSTSYRGDARWQPRELRGVRAVVPLIDNTVLAQEETRRLLQLAARIAPRAVALQGARPEAAEVAPRLLAYLDDLLAGGPPSPAAAAGAVLERARAALDATALGPPDEILPPRFVRIDDFLDPDAHARLLAYALRREADFARSGVLDPDGVAKVDETFRRSVTLFDLAEVRHLFEERLRRLLPHVRQELGLPWFPVGRMEAQISVHRQGDFFGRHVDNGGATVRGRSLTCVYYFHAQPKRYAGGDLKIYERHVRGQRIEPGPGHEVIRPENNTAVFFASDTPHEVDAIRQESAAFGDSRFSLTVWFWLGTPPQVLGTASEPAPAVPD